MKCVKNILEGTIKRVTDSAAHDMVLTNAWAYCPKSEWKLAVRPQPKPKAEKDKVAEKDESDKKKPYKKGRKKPKVTK